MANIKIFEKLGFKPKAAAKYCKHCGKLLPSDNFYKNKHFSSGLESWCKECLSAYNKTRKKSHTMCSTPNISMGLINEVAREKRKSLGWTQDDVAKRAEVSMVTVCRFEKGGNVTFDIASKIVEALNCKIVIADNNEKRKTK